MAGKRSSKEGILMFYKISIGDLCLQMAATIYYIIRWDVSPIYYFIRWDFSFSVWSSEVEIFSDFASFFGDFQNGFWICSWLIFIRVCFVVTHLSLFGIEVPKFMRGSHEKEFTKKYISQLLIGVIYVLCTSVRICCTWITFMWIT